MAVILFVVVKVAAVAATATIIAMAVPISLCISGLRLPFCKLLVLWIKEEILVW